MKFSLSSHYAISALVALVGPPNDPNLDASQRIANELGIPEQFLRKVLRRVEIAGLVESRTGRRGGYRLARPAAAITLLEIIEAVEGPLQFEAVPIGGKAAERVAFLIGEALEWVNDACRRLLNHVTLAELARDMPVRA